MTFPKIVRNAAVVLLIAVAPALAGDGALTTDQEQAVKDVVRGYLRDNPEVLVEAIRALQAKQEAQAGEKLASIRGELENDPSSPVGGNPNGDVTIVEFFDYRCGFCKKAVPAIQEILKTDGKIRYVFREFPILGPESLAASRIALAVWNIDREKYVPLHMAFMRSKGSLSESKAFSIAAKVGLDIDKLRVAAKDPRIDKMIERNMELAATLSIDGTPAFIIGETIARGYIGLEEIRAAVEEARKG